VHASLDREPGGRERFGNPGRGLFLLETEFRIGVNPPAQADQIGASRF